jgi:hypothetical protein
VTTALGVDEAIVLANESYAAGERSMREEAARVAQELGASRVAERILGIKTTEEH